MNPQQAQPPDGQRDLAKRIQKRRATGLHRAFLLAVSLPFAQGSGSLIETHDAERAGILVLTRADARELTDQRCTEGSQDVEEVEP